MITEKREQYATEVEYGWVGQYRSFLRETYPRECRRLEGWLKRYTGTVLSLELLAGNWRWSAEHGFVQVYFGSVLEAFSHLAERVQQGMRLDLIQVDFARDLHYGENYPEAIAVLDNLLVKHPSHVEGRTIMAVSRFTRRGMMRPKTWPGRCLSTRKMHMPTHGSC